MRALWSFYLAVTRFFGARRRFVRSLAALCLVVLGVHAAADVIDDLVYRVIDALDLVVDGVAWSALETLAGWGAFSPQEAARHAQGFAELIDLEQKDAAAKWLALVVELLMDLLLLDFVRGARAARSAPLAGVPSTTMVEELRSSARELKEALSPLDLERLAVPPAIAGFAVAGTLGAALAVEGFLADTFSSLVPLWRWGPNASAGVALLVAALLLWRFLPDLLHGAILRAHERGRRAAHKGSGSPSLSSSSLSSSPRWAWLRSPGLVRARALVRRSTRGALLAFVVLPLAVLGLSGQAAIFALIARTGTGL